MLGLFGTLNLGQRSLQTQQQGIEVAGHNLANVNNPAFARQRVIIQTSPTVQTGIGPQGTGADAVGIQQLRSALLDQQIQSEITKTGFYTSEQSALQYAQADLGQQIDRQSSSAEGAAASQGLSGQHALAQGISDLFNSFQSFSTNSRSSTERQILTQKAAALASQFNLVDQRLGQLRNYLDDNVRTDVASANKLIDNIAHLNDRIISTENGTSQMANDLRDQRQQQIEELAKLVPIHTMPGPSGGLDISIEGNAIITGRQVVDHVEAFDSGGGQILVRTQTGQTPLALPAGAADGSMSGTISARDDTIGAMRKDLNNLATQLITEVNTIHQACHMNG